MMGRLRRGAAAVGLLVALVAAAIGGAGPAAAHPTLLFTDPAADTAVPAASQAITLTFNEPVTIGPDALVLLDRDGHRVPTGPAATTSGARTITATLTGTLPPGSYTVRWRATGTDGDLVEEQFRFGVGYTLTATTDSAAAAPINWWSAGLRWVLFAGFAIGFGGLIAQRYIDSARTANSRLPQPRSPTTLALGLALAAALGLATQEVIDTRGPSGLWRTGSGAILVIEAAGLAAAVALTATRRRVWALAALLAVLGAEGWRAHPHTAAGPWGASVTAVHLAAAATWVGALVTTTLAVLAWRRESAALAWVLRGYMRLAVWTFAVVITSGVVAALLLVPLAQVFTTAYGWVLVVKVVLVLIAAGLAVTARTLQRQPARIAALPRVMRAEVATLVAVLAASATLVSTAPPTGAAQPAPPAPHGPVLPRGALAGQIGVAVQASDGQLVARLSAPRRGDYYAAAPDRHYRLSGRLVAPDGHDAVLTFRSCGPECFVAPAIWGDGDNVLSLAVGADDARGGAISLLVPWPTLPGAAELARAVAATRAAGRITVYEAVTSDPTAGSPPPTPLDLPPEFFLSQEPYADGTAPQAIRLAGSGATRLALGYPAAAINVLLTLDRAGRISDEILTDPKHLVTRRFVYPDHD